MSTPAHEVVEALGPIARHLDLASVPADLDSKTRAERHEAQLSAVQARSTP